MKNKNYFTLGLALVVIPIYALAQPSDAQIAAIVVAANQVDIDAGQLAVTQAKDAGAIDLAKMMVRDHTAVNQSAVELVTKLKVTPEANPTSKSLLDGGAANLVHLRTLSGAAFDRAYVEHEVVYHEQVIKAIEGTLIPNAQNAELKALLVKVLPAFHEHLKHAKHVQSMLH